MKLDLNTSLLNLDGSKITYTDQPDKCITAGKLLATFFISATKGDAIKLYDWANLLYKDEVLTIDRSDLDIIKAFVKETAIPNLQKAQILIALNNVIE